jgi:enoyl-CoA hydratase/carnithine racemase
MEAVILEKGAATGVATIVLNRPEKRNAMNAQLVDDVMSALEEIRADHGINAVITKGRGQAYRSGLDLCLF